jgi:tetratricopeptide (TPR) repeat protein
MTAPEMMHPSEETLAAFMEGRLEQAARKQVLQHLDMEDCGECREALLLVAEVDAVEHVIEHPTNVEPIPFWKRLWIPLVAAATVVVLLLAVWPPQSEVQRIAKATEGLQFRISEARLSVDDPYRPKATVMRGPKKDTEAASNLQFLEAAMRLEERSRGDAIDRLQAIAAVRLYLGDTDLALQSLEEALKRADAEKLAPKRKAAILNDLAVAHLQSSGGTDERNLIAALDTIERARALDESPSIAWTRAVLLEAVHQKDAALRAWQDYLRLDPASAWATEAQKHVATLR